MEHTSSTFKALVLLNILLLATSCTMPRSGPRSGAYKSQASEVVQKEEQDTVPYTLVEVSAQVVSSLVQEKHKVTRDTNWPTQSVSRKVTIMPGDSIRVTIFESDTNGLFVQENTMRPGNFVTIPQLFVEDSGQVLIPYVGTVNVANMTPNDLARKIENILAKKAIDPKVVVEFINRNGYRASVIGDVNNAGKYVIDHERERILDLISKAGGARFLAFETFVTLQRDNKEYTTLLDDLINSPEKNHYVEPDDVIYVYRQPRMFQVYGAVAQKGMHTFNKREFTLSEAMGLAQGMNDNLADPAEIYIYRYTGKNKFNVSRQDAKSTQTPVIYSLDLNKADGYFLAQNFPVQENDIIYVANAETAEFRKFLTILGSAALVSVASDNAVNLGQ